MVYLFTHYSIFVISLISPIHLHLDTGTVSVVPECVHELVHILGECTVVLDERYCELFHSGVCERTLSQFNFVQ